MCSITSKRRKGKLIDKKITIKFSYGDGLVKKHKISANNGTIMEDIPMAVGTVRKDIYYLIRKQMKLLFIGYIFDKNY